jgi:DNA-binding transcriptional MerR regulator
VAAEVTIGAFSVMTGLSRKTLRHYHEQGLLEPAATDPVTGYRRYDTAQVRTAEIIRRFRALDMPVPEVRAVLAAAEPAERNAIIAAHLRRMEDQLDRTREAVGTLRELLDPAAAPRPLPAVTFRSVPPLRAAAVSATVGRGEVGAWWRSCLDELYTAARAAGAAPAGPLGGLYATELFSEEQGAATLFLPVHGDVPPSGRVRMAVVPGAELAVTVHEGSHAGAGRTYAELGTYVAERLLGVEGPVRENYLVGAVESGAATVEESAWRTEICWPVFRTSAG